MTATAKPMPAIFFGHGNPMNAISSPPALYQVQYPAPGEPALARRVQSLLAPLDVTLGDSWGLDHGTWSVLKHTHPSADIPIVQLSIDETKPASFHFDVGRSWRRCETRAC